MLFLLSQVLCVTKSLGVVFLYNMHMISFKKYPDELEHDRLLEVDSCLFLPHYFFLLANSVLGLLLDRIRILPLTPLTFLDSRRVSKSAAWAPPYISFGLLTR